MENQVEMSFDQFDEKVFDELVNDAPPSTSASANDLVGASQGEEEEEDLEGEIHEEAPKPEEEEEKPKETKGKKTKAPKKEEEVEEEITEAADTTDTAEVDEITANLLEAKFKGLVERGIWTDVNLPEGFVWTEENYGELAVLQAQWKAEDMFNEMVDQSGDYGKVIFDHIKNGGNPDEIIDLFKQAKKLEVADITSQDGQEAIVREYYKTLNWSDKKINNFIESAVDRKTLKDEAEEVKELMEKDIHAQVEETKRQQEEYRKQQETLQKQFANNMKQVVTSRKDISDKEKKELLGSLLEYNQKLPDGRVVNQFTVDFMKLQADPQKYIDLVLFVKNPEKYMQKIAKETETKQTKKTWDLIKGNGSLKTGTGTSHTQSKEKKQADLKIDWKSLKI
jgi:hypothetical protein